MPYKNRARLPIMFMQPQFPMERSIFRLADGSSRVQSVVIRNTYEGKTDQLPEDWHRKLVIALAHDEVTIENERLMSNVVLDGDYQIDWQDFLNYPIAQANLKVQVTPFDATNSNCQTCEEMAQVVLVDDTTTDVWDEGTTNIFPDVLTDNDSICCYPFTITLVEYNVLYFSSVTIDANGVLTATVIDPAPIIDDVWVATYRVTCDSGAYDEADVYANITGSDVSFCYPAIGASFEASSSTAGIVSWGVPVPIPVGDWIWTLYESSDLGTPIQSGTVAPGAGAVALTGLTAGVDYTISIVSDCGGGNYSIPTVLEFSITSFAADTCGEFTVVYLPSVDAAPQSISYMDCAGVVTDRVFAVPETVNICMLIVAGAEDPLYFVASSVDISINYVGLCP